MTTPLFSTFRQGEKRVTATFLAVLERLSLPNIDRILRSLLRESSFGLVSFTNQVQTGISVPDAKIGTGGAVNAIWIETKTTQKAVDRCQIERHLESVSEREKLLVLTPDYSEPEVLQSIAGYEDKFTWSSFNELAEVINDILTDEHEPPTERESFLLRELVSMFREDGLLGRSDVMVVAASSGWPMYKAIPVYRCALSLPVRSPDQFNYIGFYAGGEIKRIVPRVKKVVESINLTRQEERDALDPYTKGLAENLWQKIKNDPEQSSWFDGNFKVMFLSEHDDRDQTVDLEPLTKRGPASEADERTPDGQEGFMNVGAALVTHPQPAELVQPPQGSLHHPAVHSQPAAVFRASSGQGRRDVALPQFLAMPPGVIGPVGVQPLRPATGSTPLTAHRRHGLHQGQQLGYVVAIGPGQDGR